MDPTKEEELDIAAILGHRTPPSQKKVEKKLAKQRAKRLKQLRDHLSALNEAILNEIEIAADLDHPEAVKHLYHVLHGHGCKCWNCTQVA